MIAGLFGLGVLFVVLVLPFLGAVWTLTQETLR
jgi:hypothetical protein